MKLDRLLGILILLSKNEIITAPALASQFEVSRRTINRDIETLCMAGIPIVTKQGNNGGIYIQDGYKLDKNIFNENELSQIVVGLKAIGSVSQGVDIDMLVDKITPAKSTQIVADNIIKVELGSFYKDSISQKIDVIKEAVSKSRQVEFTYYSKNGESQKRIEPYYVIFKWSSWYLYGHSCTDDEFRLYKLNRLWDIGITDKEFTKREIDDKIKQLDNIFPSNYHLEAILDESQKYILVETYGNKSYTVLDDGRLQFEVDFTNYDFMLNWILGLGDRIEVIEPKELVDDIIKNVQSTLDIYK